jgi:hypothetical protein
MTAVALRSFDVISRPYREQQIALHARPQGYGGKGSRWASTVLAVRDAYGCRSILDYGCGRGTLGDALLLSTGTRPYEYDPAVEGKTRLPGFADLVVCTDVLEHIEPDKLDNVFEHLRVVTRKALFVVICTRLSSKTLPDGRNAHLIVQHDAWWRARVEAAGFTVHDPPAVHPAKMPSKAWIAVLVPCLI